MTALILLFIDKVMIMVAFIYACLSEQASVTTFGGFELCYCWSPSAVNMYTTTTRL